jgi:hypothetical protein
MRFEKFSFGSIRIDGVTYEHDVVIDRGKVRKRKKKPSKKFRDAFGDTPLSARRENTLEMPKAPDRHRNRRTAGHERSKAGSKAPENQIAGASNNQAIKLKENPDKTNAILHVTC